MWRTREAFGGRFDTASSSLWRRADGCSSSSGVAGVLGTALGTTCRPPSARPSSPLEACGARGGSPGVQSQLPDARSEGAPVAHTIPIVSS